MPRSFDAFDADEAPTRPWSRHGAIHDTIHDVWELLPEKTVVTPSPFETLPAPGPPDPLGGGPTRVTPYALLPLEVRQREASGGRAAPPVLTFLPGRDSALGLPCIEVGAPEPGSMAQDDDGLGFELSAAGPLPLSTLIAQTNGSAGSVVPLRASRCGAVRPRGRSLTTVEVDEATAWTLAGRIRLASLGLLRLVCHAAALLFRRPVRVLDATR